MKDPRMKLHMRRLGLALAPCLKVWVHRKLVCFLHYCTFRELQKKQKLLFPMWSWVLFNDTPDGWSIDFEVPHMCAVHLDPPSFCQYLAHFCNSGASFDVKISVKGTSMPKASITRW